MHEDLGSISNTKKKNISNNEKIICWEKTG